MKRQAARPALSSMWPHASGSANAGDTNETENESHDTYRLAPKKGLQILGALREVEVFQEAGPIG
jgi:hypothetical protein